MQLILMNKIKIKHFENICKMLNKKIDNNYKELWEVILEEEIIKMII